MSGLRTPLLIKCWYYLLVMTILYSLPTLDSVKLDSNQSTIPTQASSNTTALPTLRPSLFLTPIPSLPPTIVSTISSPIVATSSPPSLSLSLELREFVNLAKIIVCVLISSLNSFQYH